MKAFLVGLGIIAAGLMLAVVPAQALVFDLTSNHCDPPDPCGAPGTVYGTVTLTQNGGNVNFDVKLNSPYDFAKTGALDFQAFEFNATDVILSDIDVTQNAAGQTLVANAPVGGFTQGSVGAFAFGIACSTCKNGLADGFNTDLLFSVSFSTIADFTTPNALGNVFVADIGNTTNGATGAIDAGGGVGGGGVGGSTVPEPATLLLLGSGLLGLGLANRVRGLLQK